ncbi:hypothetical protein [Nocardioides sp. SYSU DS0663]|uniref:hypothetical protein n=1 Tax=Nocardioides sp. SYSU DS0663 TaxID=3416445 RepID=UPI003F4C5EC0
MSDAARGERRARAWVVHLRDGGTTPWLEWSGEADVDGTALRDVSPGVRSGVLPGAQQLELLRRLNAAGPVPPALAQQVLGASAAGRGQPDLDLVGAGADAAFGPPPVDPAALPADELLRVATSLLADRLAATPLPPRRRPRPSRWRRGYRLVGDRWLADAVREELVARGRPPGGRRAVVLVLGTDLPTMLADAWRHRVTTEGGPPWPEWLEGTVARDRVPPRVDLLRAARTWAGRVGPGRVRLVLDPAHLPRLTGTRGALPAPPAVSADGAELARRVAPVLGLLVPAERRTALLRRVLVPRLAAAGGEPLAVPAQHHPWVRRRAAGLHAEVRSAGYAVAGDLATLLAGPQGSLDGGQPSDAGVLQVALRLLLEPTTEPQGPAQSRPLTSTEDR